MSMNARRHPLTILLIVAAALLLTACTVAVQPLPGAATAQPASEAAAPDAPAAPASEADEAGQAAASDADLYAELLANSVTDTGLITTHHMGERWFLEIPADLLGRELFWYSELAEMPASFVGVAGLQVGSRMVKFERMNDRIFVRDLSDPLQKRSTLPVEPGDQPTSEEKQEQVSPAIEAFSLPTVLAALPIAGETPDGALVIDVTDVFASDLTDFSAVPMLGMSGIQVVGAAPDRSFIQSIKTFPRNLEIRSFLTYNVAGDISSTSVVVSHSITLLPDDPMMPRFFDPRVGYFTISFDDFGATDAAGSVVREFINRYRLEKADPGAELSDPVKPIVYYIDRNWPDKWRPYIKQAVEDWQVAFEAAGFSNAIIAMDAPSVEEDPDWDPSDTRYSVIRWVEQPHENAMGPNTHDPRTGEILSAHVLVWSDVLKLIEQWYFTQASAIDPRAQTLPLPDDLMGRLLRYAVSHEVGHSIGLRHNHRASQVFTIEQLRDPLFTAEYGTTPSIMSYGRFNYIAQPEDGVTNIIPQIGPYDRFAIHWGYTPIPDARTPGEEWPTLNAWAERQRDDPFLVFGGEDLASMVDPNVLTENLGSDRIEAARLGIQNLERVMGHIVGATTYLGSDYSKLAEMYDAVLGQRYGWLAAAIKLVGGVEEDRTLAGLGNVEFHRVPRERQQAAVAFILENLQTPQAFLAPDVMDNLAAFAVTSSLADQQHGLLDRLLSGFRYNLLAEQAVLDPANAYPLVDYLGDIQAGLFAELQDPAPQVDPMRRALQRHYLTVLAQQMQAFDGPSDPSVTGAAAFLHSDGQGTDLRAAARYNLARLAGALEAALPAAADATTAAHLADLHATIAEMLGGASPENTAAGQP